MIVAMLAALALAGPSGPTNDNTPTFSWDGENATCAVDGNNLRPSRHGSTTWPRRRCGSTWRCSTSCSTWWASWRPGIRAEVFMSGAEAGSVPAVVGGFPAAAVGPCLECRDALAGVALEPSAETVTLLERLRAGAATPR